MRRRFALVLVLLATALACSGRTTTGATPADAATGGQGLADGAAPRTGGASDATTCIDASIVAKSYDQSCKVDTDCVAIVEGNVCVPCVFQGVLTAAINSGAVANYNSNIANTPGATGIGGAGCSTGGGTVSGNSNWGPFCCSGTCHVGSQCPSAADAGTRDAATDAACQANVPLGCSCPTVDEGGGLCVCANCSMPACPKSVQEDFNNSLSCTAGESCMNCIGGVAGIECGCSNAGPLGADGGAHWQCIGTEQSCAGGTFQ